MNKLEKIRTAVADYMTSEGCGCCQNIDAHKEHTETLAVLLNVPPYSDGSGYNFYLFCSDKKYREIGEN